MGNRCESVEVNSPATVRSLHEATVAYLHTLERLKDNLEALAEAQPRYGVLLDLVAEAGNKRTMGTPAAILDEIADPSED